MQPIKLQPIKSKGDGYKSYKSTLKSWLQKRAKIKQAKEAAKQNKK